MANYIYLPVPAGMSLEKSFSLSQALQVPDDNILRNDALEGTEKARNRVFGGCLRPVGTNDHLYVFLHGGEVDGVKVVGEYRKPNETGLKKYDAEALARTLRKEGLTRKFVNLYLVACNAGTNGYGADLKAAMQGRRYSSIQVTSYLGICQVGANVFRIWKDGGPLAPTHQDAFVTN